MATAPLVGALPKPASDRPQRGESREHYAPDQRNL